MGRPSVSLVVLLGAVSACAQSPRLVRLDGVGQVKIGMTLSDLNIALHEKFSLPEQKEDQGCFYVNPKGYPALMIQGGKVVRIDVDAQGTSTAKGIQVGDTEARAKQVYGTELKIKPSAYDGDEGGHYLTLRSGRYGLRFETEHGKITEFYAGTADAIQYIEGCE